MNKFMLGVCVSVTVVFVFFPKRELERFVFFGNIRIVMQIIPEVQLIRIAFLAYMQRIDLVCKALRCMSPVQCDSFRIG